MSKNDFEEFQKQIQKMFGSNAKVATPFDFQAKDDDETDSPQEVEEEVET